MFQYFTAFMQSPAGIWLSGISGTLATTYLIIIRKKIGAGLDWILIIIQVTWAFCTVSALQ
jgi:hypothetical protein